MTTLSQITAVIPNFRAVAAEMLRAIPGVTVIDGHPVMIEPGVLPVVMLDMVTIRRPGPDEGDSQLGSRDWHVELPIEIYVDANEDVQDPATASALAENLLSQVIEVFDLDPQMSNWGNNGFYSGIEAVLVVGEPFVGALNGTSAPVLGYSAVLEAFLLVPT